MGLIELLLGVVFAVSFGVGIGLGAMGDAGNFEFWIARACFIVASAAVAGAFWVWWREAGHVNWHVIVLGAAAGLWIFVGLPFQLSWLTDREAKVKSEVTSHEPTPPPSPLAPPPPATSSPQSEISLFLQCKWGPLPKTMPPEGRIFVLESLTTSPDYGGGSLSERFGSSGSPIIWRGEDKDTIVIGHRCEFFNYSDAPIFNLMLVFKMDLLEAIKNESGGFQSGGFLKTVEWRMLVPKIDPGPSNQFVFYLFNNWKFFLRFNLPEEAYFQYRNERNRHAAVITSPSSYPMFLNPAEDIKPN